MSAPERRRQPSIYARLAEQQERRFIERRPSRTAKVFGWIVVVAIIALVVQAAIEVHPW